MTENITYPNMHRDDRLTRRGKSETHMCPGADPGTPKRTPRNIKCTLLSSSSFCWCTGAGVHARLLCYSTIWRLQFVWYKYFLIYHPNTLFCPKGNSEFGLIILHLDDCSQDFLLSGSMALDNTVKFLSSMSLWWKLKCTFHQKRSTKHGMK